MIDKLHESEMLHPLVLGEKINELIDKHNQLEAHFDDLVIAHRNHQHLFTGTEWAVVASSAVVKGIDENDGA